MKGNQGKSGGKGGDNNKEGAATGAARGQFRLPAGALARPGCGGSGGDKAEPAAASGPKVSIGVGGGLAREPSDSPGRGPRGRRCGAGRVPGGI